ncbi:hypothetical protein V1517DRAFT_331838 [Lipomyces orientalis]|uniref:Uncharacterized protein n=1 Tax=Lipomyces orientalis TaxID=1233043 RepID=A0ACC3TFI4_9ASCO
MVALKHGSLGAGGANDDDDDDDADDAGSVITRVLDAVLRFNHLDGVRMVSMRCEAEITTTGRDDIVPLFDREWIAEEFQSKEVAFVPFGWSPAFGTFSSTATPACFERIVNRIERNTSAQNRHIRFVSFGSWDASTIFASPPTDSQKVDKVARIYSVLKFAIWIDKSQWK